MLFIEWLSAKPHGTFTADKTVGTAWSPALWTSTVCQLCHYSFPSRTVAVQHAKQGDPVILSDLLNPIPDLPHHGSFVHTDSTSGDALNKSPWASPDIQSSALSFFFANTSLGPQCLQCKKRRVKCGSEEPGCDKCSKDGFSCPGYSKGFTFVHVRPRTKVAASRQKSRAAPGPVTPVSTISLAPEHPQSVATSKQQLAEKQIFKRDLIPSLSSVIPSSDQQLLMFVEHAQYCKP